MMDTSYTYEVFSYSYEVFSYTKAKHHLKLGVKNMRFSHIHMRLASYIYEVGIIHFVLYDESSYFPEGLWRSIIVERLQFFF